MRIDTAAVTPLQHDRQAVRAIGRVTCDPVPYGNLRAANPRRWQPNTVAIVWERFRDNGGEWSRWSDSSPTLSGPTVRKDGSFGEVRHERYFVSFGQPEIRAWIETTRPPAGDALPEPFDASGAQDLDG